MVSGGCSVGGVTSEVTLNNNLTAKIIVRNFADSNTTVEVHVQVIYKIK